MVQSFVRDVAFLTLLSVIFLAMAFCPGYSRAECGPQNYDSDEQPDFDCPSPGERDIVPPINPPLAISQSEGDQLLMPWDGALVHRDRLILTGLKVKALRRLRWLDRQITLRREEIEEEYRAEVADTNEELCTARVDHYQGLAAAATQEANRSGAWYRSFGFGLAIGLVIAGVLVGLAAYVVSII